MKMTCLCRGLSPPLTASKNIKANKQQTKKPQTSLPFVWDNSISASWEPFTLNTKANHCFCLSFRTSSSFSACGSCLEALVLLRWANTSLRCPVGSEAPPHGGCSGENEFLGFSGNILSDWRFPLCFLSVLLCLPFADRLPDSSIIHIPINKCLFVGMFPITRPTADASEVVRRCQSLTL